MTSTDHVSLCPERGSNPHGDCSPGDFEGDSNHGRGANTNSSEPPRNAPQNTLENPSGCTADSPVATRFWAKVEKTETCWLWLGGRSKTGYGKFGLGTGKGWKLAHRAAYELAVGPIPEGLTLDHLCRVRHCVNPAHLEPVTFNENVRRGLAGVWGKSKTHCPKGHGYTEANTYRNPTTGYRVCRECLRAGNRASRARAKARL